MKKVGRIILLIIGLLFFVIGSIGIFLPVLPTTPFFLIAIYLISLSSARVTNKILSSRFYRNYIQPIKEKKPITMKRRIKIILAVTFVFGLGLYFITNWIFRILIIVIWSIHMIYFLFFGKRIENDDSNEQIK